MKALLRPSTLSVVRKALIILLLLSWLVVPELLWQKLSFIAYKLGLILHLVYEVWAFVLEEALIHGMDMPKHYAQMTVFYLSLLVGLGVIYEFGRRLPHWLMRLKSRFGLLMFELKFQLFKTWLSLNIWQKSKYILLHLTAVAGVFLIMLS